MTPEKRCVVAIDPGAKGAIASYVWVDGDASWDVRKLAESPQDRFSQLETHRTIARRLNAPGIAVLEDVGGFIGVPQPGSRMFSFGRGYGQLEGMLIALEFQLIRVRPQKWQSGLSIKSRKGESKPDHKRRMRQMALDLFPGLKPTLDTADALLILWWFIHERNE